jgi:hypothetical protein
MHILRSALGLVDKINFANGFAATTHLDLEIRSKNSSTLIAMVARWMGCDPF